MIHGSTTHYSGDVAVMLKIKRCSFIAHCFMDVMISLLEFELGNGAGRHSIMQC